MTEKQVMKLGEAMENYGADRWGHPVWPREIRYRLLDLDEQERRRNEG